MYYMHYIKLNAIKGKLYNSFVEKVILKGDRFLVPFYHEDELEQWESYKITDREGIDWVLDLAEDDGQRLAMIPMQYYKMKEKLQSCNSILEFLTFYNLEGILVERKGELLAGISLEWDINICDEEIAKEIIELM